MLVTLVRHSNHRKSHMIGCYLSLSTFCPNQLSTTTLSSGPASCRRNLPIIISIAPRRALTPVNTFSATCTWTRRGLLSSCGSEAAPWTFRRRTQWNASLGRWTCSIPHTKPVKQAVVFFPSRRDTEPMMLKHVGESLQGPGSQLLHQILHFWIQHPVLGKMLSFIIVDANAAPLSCAVRFLSCRLANSEGGPQSRYRYQSSWCSPSNRRIQAACGSVRIEAAATHLSPES